MGALRDQKVGTASSKVDKSRSRQLSDSAISDDTLVTLSVSHGGGLILGQRFHGMTD